MTNDKDGAALLPCPFCGGDAVMRRDDDPSYPWYVTFEHEPDCTMYALPTDMFRSFSTEAEASAAWNRRTALKSHGQAFDAAGVREACAKVAESWVKCDYSEECNILAGSIADEIRALPIPGAPASVEPVAGGTYRHVKRGTAYNVIGHAELQASTFNVHEGDKLVIYRGGDGKMWARLYDEFHDGRFELVTAEPDTIGSNFGNGGGFDPVRACGCPECEASPGFGGGDLREALELAIADASYHLSKYRPHVLKALKAALAALPPVKQSVGKFQRGDHVEKISGSNWRGKIVGEYATELTPEGYAVESDTETGSVQIYPAKALRLSHDQRGGSGE